MKASIGVSLLVVVVLTVAACGSIQRVKVTKGSFVIAEHPPVRRWMKVIEPL